MLGYRHSFHAGNFGDVFKHAVLALALEALGHKDKPFYYLDTHAGAGRYDLAGKYPVSTGESAEGIGRLWPPQDTPRALAPYLDAVTRLNPNGRLRYYPGSPLIARGLLRENDRMEAMELHSSDHPLLARSLTGDRRVRVAQEDGFQALQSRLPPRERRGLVMIDPAYELKADFAQVVEGLAAAHRRWATGVYLLWYPLVGTSPVGRMLKEIQALALPKTLLAELHRRPASKGRGMTGCGVVMVNPPWPLTEALAELLPWLGARLAAQPGQGHTRLEWLVPE